MEYDNQVKIRKAIEEKEPINMNDEELKYSMKPIGKAHLNVPKKPRNTKYNYVKCEICGKEYCTKNSGKHRKTQHHQLYENLNSKLKKLLLS